MNDELDNLLTWPENWDTHNAKAPDPHAVARARAWITDFSNAVGRTWIDPNITASGSGEVVFEWWQNEKQLTFYVNANCVEYLKSCGTNIEEWQDGEANTVEECLSLWQWLTQGLKIMQDDQIDVSFFISLIGEAHKEGKRLADQIARGIGGREIALTLTNLEQARHWAVDALMLLQSSEQPINSSNFIANSSDSVHQAMQKHYESKLPPGIKIRGK